MHPRGLQTNPLLERFVHFVLEVGDFSMCVRAACRRGFETTTHYGEYASICTVDVFVIAGQPVYHC